ncbi:MAG: right-handed parallel beta-helix repeat-containing protein [Nitrospiraceae bacterium]|nr:MAG: right-handed parallel beta-helix repeat-containing protein [Nitrospiraceae bacterium]
MTYLRAAIVSSFLAFLLFPPASMGETIIKDTVWSGEIHINDDVLVSEGVTLTILPGTIVNIEPSDRTKTDPEYLSSLREITIRGRLNVQGTEAHHVVFRVIDSEASDRWAGIIIYGGTADIKWCTVRNAETGFQIYKGHLHLIDSVSTGNRYGLAAQGVQSFVQIKNTRITGNEYGVFEISGAKISYSSSFVGGNRKKDIYVYGIADKEEIKSRKEIRDDAKVHFRDDRSCLRTGPDVNGNYAVPHKEITRRYEDYVLLENTVWRGRILINGIVRVPEKIRLVIVPGTVIEFLKKDTNSDGIGENGLLMQGVLIAKGTRDNPIIFRSAEIIRSMGDWDAINIMNSDGVQNLVEHCRIEDAYIGLHFHFANVMVQGTVLQNNYQAIQFQESAVEMKGNYFFNNKGGVKGRDSEIIFTGNYVYNNVNGVNFFRASLTASNNKILGNLNEGLKIREGAVTVRENIIDCNRSGLMINDSFYGRFSSNVITNNFETGIALKGSDNVDLSGNFIQGSGFNGINILSSGGEIKDNSITENGERGIGIQSFTGTISDNSITGNGLYAIENEGAQDVSAPGNWWGEDNTDDVIYDKGDEHYRGKIDYLPVKKEPVHFTWPVRTVLTNVAWNNSIHIRDQIEVLHGAALTIAPGTKVVLSKGAGVKISSARLIAAGEKDRRITFTSFEKDGGGLWDEILLEQADGSMISYCDFEYATWALHSHFTALRVNNSRFIKNQGGMRFRSGPVEITGSLFKENSIGIRAFMANALIENNDMYENETGIFVREGGGGLTIRRNNIYSNKNYNIRVGDFNMEDINAKENWWGAADPAVTIFDARREPGIGTVVFEPVLNERVKILE